MLLFTFIILHHFQTLLLNKPTLLYVKLLISLSHKYNNRNISNFQSALQKTRSNLQSTDHGLGFKTSPKTKKCDRGLAVKVCNFCLTLVVLHSEADPSKLHSIFNLNMKLHSCKLTKLLKDMASAKHI